MAIPTITNIEPNYGVYSGGTKIVITGENFTGVTNLWFEDGGMWYTPVFDFTIDSDTQITVTTPDAQITRIINIGLENGDGTSINDENSVFNFINPADYPFETAFEMTDTNLGSSNSDTRSFASSRIYFNKSDFDGNPLFYFEIVAENGNSNNNYSVSIYDRTDGVVIVASIEIPANTKFPVLLRSSDFIPANGDREYAVMVDQTSSSYNLKVYAARLVVSQDSTLTKTVVSIPLANGDKVISINSQSAISVYGSNYLLDNINSSWWYKDSDKWAGVYECALDVVCAGMTSGSAVVQLIDVDNSAAPVTDSLIVSDGTTLTHTVSTFSWENIPDKTHLQLGVKSSSKSRTAVIYRGFLNLKINNLTKWNLYNRLSKRLIPTSNTHAHEKIFYAPENYPEHICYLEGTGKCLIDTIYTKAYETDENTGTASSELLSGSEINWEVDKKLKSSEQIFPSSSKYIIGYIDGEADPNSICLSNLLFVVSFGSSASEVKKRQFIIPEEREYPVEVRDYPVIL